MTNHGEHRRPVAAEHEPLVGPIEDEHRELRTRLETLEAERAGVLSTLLELPKMLADHFADEERIGGLYEDVARRSPAVGSQIDALRAEHRAILEELEALSRAAQGNARPDGSVDENTMRGVARCVERLRQHEHSESKMIADVYYSDEGGRG